MRWYLQDALHRCERMRALLRLAHCQRGSARAAVENSGNPHGSPPSGGHWMPHFRLACYQNPSGKPWS